MNQDIPAGEPANAAPPSAPTPPDSTVTDPAPSTPSAPQRKVPSWLPMALLAIVPAVVVGLAVYFIAGGGSGADNTGAVEGFLRLSAEGELDVFQDRTPPGYPDDIPLYGGATLVASFLIEQEGGVSYFVVYSTSASLRQVYEFYRERLDADPWQIEVGSDSREVQGLSFSSPEDADVSGDLTMFRSELEDKTIIYISFQDLTPSSEAQASTDDFQPGDSLALPEGFPTDVPIFEEDASQVIDSYFQRGAGFTQFYVAFVTQAPQTEVLDFYREEFERRGWTVVDSTDTGSGFSLGIDFNDSGSTIQGSIVADTFVEDDGYTQVDMLIQVQSGRTPSRGN